MASRLRRWWDAHGHRTLGVANVLLAAYACLKLGSEFGRLLLRTPPGPMDLHWFHVMAQRWATGRSVYVLDISGPPAAYPPATFPLLYPLLGWFSVEATAWLWAVLDVAALAWLAVTCSRHSGATTARGRVFAALWPLAANATGVVVGNGQTTLFVLPLLVASALRVRTSASLASDLLTAAMFVFALSKPNVAVPFFWILLFTAASRRVAVMTACGYAVATMIGAALQPHSLGELLAHAARNGQWVAGRNGYLDLSLALHHLGASAFILPASALVLAGLGGWVFLHRHRDTWLLLGVTTIVARLWTYHSVYDDAIMVVSMVALARVATSDRGTTGTIAGVLVGANVVTMLALTSWINTRTPMLWVSVAVHAVTWGASLAFLLAHARRDDIPAS